MNFLQIILQIQPAVFAIFAAKLWNFIPISFTRDLILLNTGKLPYKLSELIKNAAVLWWNNTQKKKSSTYKPKNWKINWKISPTSKYIRVKFFIPIKLTVFSFRVQVNAFYTSFSVFPFCFCSKKKRERERIMGERYVEHTFMVFFTIRGVCMRC